MADVTINYSGEAIATMSASGTKTLSTSGKYCEDDIEVVYVSPGGGGSLGTKSITANGTYNASSDNLDGYSQVTVTVPNTYSAGDEGKVVDDGALVSQTAHADVTPTTTDQTIDTTLNNSLKVKGDADLVAGNIKKDVQIFGVTGSYEGSGGVSLGPMDYPVIITNGRASGTISLKPITYSDAVQFTTYASNVAAGTSATVNNLMTDGEYVWFNLNNVSAVSYNNQSYTDFVKSESNWKLKIPSGFDGTIPFVFTT